MHRLFVALRPPPAMRQACLAAIEDGPPGWAWQDEEQLHLTLRYIGVVDRPVAEDVAAALGSIHSPTIELALSGVGWFDHGPRGALFARVAPVDPLAALHTKLDRALVRAGLKPEGRAFLPHITLARRRSGAVDPAGWLERNAGLASGAAHKLDDPVRKPHWPSRILLRSNRHLPARWLIRFYEATVLPRPPQERRAGQQRHDQCG